MRSRPERPVSEVHDGDWTTIREELLVTEGIWAGLDSGALDEILQGRLQP